MGLLCSCIACGGQVTSSAPRDRLASPEPSSVTDLLCHDIKTRPQKFLHRAHFIPLEGWKSQSDNNNREGTRTLGFCLSSPTHRWFWEPVYRQLKNSGLGDTKHFHECLTEYAPHHLLPRLWHRALGNSIPVWITSQTKLSVQPTTRRHKLGDYCYLLLQVVTCVRRAAKCEWHTCWTISNFLNSP